jgi:beta-fructofuranosidase
MVLATPDGAEQTVILLERHAAGEVSATLTLDRSRSSADARVDHTPRSGPVPIGPDGEIAVRLLVDHSALEVFANGRALTARVYPTRDDARQVHARVTRGAAKLDVATVWQMHGIWEGPRALWPSGDGLVP